MQLVTVLFHLVVLGALALISTMDVPTGLPIRDLVVKLGVVLLMLGIAHGVTMAILVTVRNGRQDEQLLQEEINADLPGTARQQEARVYTVDQNVNRNRRGA